MKTRELPERIRRWSEAPAVNPRYRGATPMDVARALVGKRPEHPAEDPSRDPEPVKSDV